MPYFDIKGVIYNFNSKSKKHYAKREVYDSLVEIPKEYGVIKKTKYDSYWVTDKGKVIGFNSSCNKFTILRPFNSRGYLCVIIIQNKRRITAGVHRLVLSTFCPIKNMYKYQVNHKDEDKSNNCLSNLEWMTPGENTTYSQGKAVECRCYRTNKFIGIFPSTHEAARSLNILQAYLL